MITFQTLGLIFFGTYLIGGLIIWDNYLSQSRHRMTTVNEISTPNDIQYPEESNKTLPLLFEDYITAYHVLQELDVFESIPIKYINVSKGAVENYYDSYLGLKPEDTYCARHRARFVTDPSFIFESQNYFQSHHPITLARGEVIPEIGGKDMHPDISYFMPVEIFKEFKYELKPDITNFFTHNELYTRRSLGKHFSCLTQMSNHLPGHENLYRKDFVAQALVRYARKHENKTECFNYDKFFPKGW